VTKQATQSALNIQSTFLDVSRSITVGHLPHSAETRASAPQLGAQFLAAPVEQFPENHSTEQSACWVADCTHNSRPNADIEAHLIPTFVGSMRIAPCPEVTFNIPSCIKYASSVYRMLCKKCYLICSVLMSYLFAKLHFRTIGMDAIDSCPVLRGLSVVIIPIIVQYHVSFSRALVPELQLSNQWMTCTDVCCRCYTSCLAETLGNINYDIVMCILVQQYRGLKACRSITRVCIL
jgi:hypothetical protein